jgi:hypothetical protein
MSNTKSKLTASVRQVKAQKPAKAEPMDAPVGPSMDTTPPPREATDSVPEPTPVVPASRVVANQPQAANGTMSSCHVWPD